MGQRALADHRRVHCAAHDDLTADDQPLDTCGRGRPGQAHGPCDFAMGQSPVDLEKFDDCLVNLVHRRPFRQISRKIFRPAPIEQQISRHMSTALCLLSD